MKNITKKGITLMALSAFVLAPMASYARLEAAVDVDSQVNSNVDANTNIDMATDTNLATSSNTRLEVDTENDLDSSIEEENNLDSTLEEESNKERRIESESNMPNTSLRVNSFGIAVASSDEVSSESDLEIFSENVSTNNDQVSKVDFDSRDEENYEVEVVYRHKGRLLGFIPVTMKSKTIVDVRSDSDTEIQSRLPWWSFLVSNKDYSKAMLKERIRNNNTVQANAKSNVSAQAKAQIAEAVIAEISSHTSVQASVSN